MEWIVRAFINNPGGAYDPAPLHEFDEAIEGVIPMIGDHLHSDTGRTYKVVARHFDCPAGRCALEVEEADTVWRFD